MAVTQLVTTVRSDFQVLPSEVNLGCQGSLKSTIKTTSSTSICTPSCALSLVSTVPTGNELDLSLGLWRSLQSNIEVDTKSLASISLLKRRNLPLPPSGVLYLVVNGIETSLKNSKVQRSDTVIIYFSIVGDFPAEPEIRFNLTRKNTKDIKSNQSNQAQVYVSNILDITTNSGVNQKVSGQIILYAEDTSSLGFVDYEFEVLDQLLGEKYTLEYGRFIVEE